MRVLGTKRGAALVAAVALGLAVAAPPVAAGSASSSAPQAEADYIVTLKPSVANVSAVADAQLDRHDGGASPGRVFRSVRGYTARLTAAEAAALASEPNVLAVERDGLMYATVTQTNAPWGLDRIDQRDRPLSTTYTYTRTGAGVTAYVFDTGIRLTHSQFGGRAVAGFSAFSGGANDCNGHGTHVASTIGGSTYGVAKGVRLVAVRILSCSGSGSISGIIAGIDWAIGNHSAGTPAVANFSLGGGASSSLDSAINRLINDGVTVAVAAGNSSANACNTSPARVPNAFTVAASNSSDQFASFSNRGSCVDIIAPGVSIPGAWYTSNTATRTISGTSMATPHVAGAAAKVLQGSPSASPSSVMSSLRSSGTSGRISGVPSGTPNLLLFTNT